MTPHPPPAPPYNPRRPELTPPPGPSPLTRASLYRNLSFGLSAAWFLLLTLSAAAAIKENFFSQIKYQALTLLRNEALFIFVYCLYLFCSTSAVITFGL